MNRRNKVTFLAKFILSLVLLLSLNITFAQQRLEMEGTAIIGNKELPKVLYIVPWKSALPVTLRTPPFTSVLDEAFKTVDRTSFKRQVKYYNDLYPEPEIKP